MNKNRVFAFLILATVAGYWVAQAGSLEPSGPPAPTMQTLAELQPNWSQLVTSARFKVVMNGEAVLDNETGLVWEKNPAGGYTPFWADAVNHCYQRIVGNRLGWRLPTVEQLTSLLEAGATGAPSLPAGHPFVLPAYFPPSGVGFWTISTYTNPNGGTQASWAVSFINGAPYVQAKGDIPLNAWCVRGGHGYDYAGQF
jgi:hypothetical protein